MRLVSCLRQVAVTLACVVAWYLLLRIPILVLFPDDDTAEIDTLATNSTLTSTGPDILLYEFDRLARPASRRMVLVGSSNVMFSLRPDDLHEALSGWEIHNVALPRSNVKQVAQVVDMVLSVSDSRTLKGTVFVLGSYFVLYAQPMPLWGEIQSPLEKEMLRYGLYGGGEYESPKPVLGYGSAAITKDLYRTLLGTDALVAAVQENTKRLLAGSGPDWKLFVGERKHPYPFLEKPAGASAQREHIERRSRQMGTTSALADEQFVLLEHLTRRISKAGARLVITEMPTPNWMRREHYRYYREQKQAFVQGLSRIPGVDYLDLVDVVPDEQMAGSTHPLRSGSRTYARAFVEALRGLRVPIR